MGECDLYQCPGHDAFDLMLIGVAMTPALSVALSQCLIGIKLSRPAIETAPAS